MAIALLTRACNRFLSNNRSLIPLLGNQTTQIKCCSNHLALFSAHLSSGPNVYDNLGPSPNPGDSLHKSPSSRPKYSLHYQTTEVLNRINYKELDRFQSDIFNWVKSRCKSLQLYSPTPNPSKPSDEDSSHESMGSNIGLVVGGANTGKTSSYLLALSDAANDPAKEVFRGARDSHRQKMMVYGSLRGSKTFVLKKFRRMKGVPKVDWEGYVVPMAIVLVPFRELGLNVFEFCSKINLRSRLLAGGRGYKLQSGLTGGRVNLVNRRERENVDVVVATPEMLLRSLNGEFEDLRIDVRFLRFLVLEESDLLSERIYLEGVNEILNMIYSDQLNLLYLTRFKTEPVVNNIKQLLLASSANTRGPVGPQNRDPLREEPEFKLIEKGLEPERNVRKVFIHSMNEDRLELLIDVLNERGYASAAKPEKTVVYCNNIKCNKFLRYSLLDRGFNITNLFGDMNYEERTESLKRFATNSNILIATSFATRFKLPCTVNNVVVFDCPRTLDEYTLYLSNLSTKNSRIFVFFNNRNLKLVKEIQSFSKEFDQFEFRNLSPKLSKKLYLNQREILKELRRLFARLTPLQRGQGGQEEGQADEPEEHALAQEQKDHEEVLPQVRPVPVRCPFTRVTNKNFRNKAIKKVEFLRKRGVLKKGYGLPKMPDRNMEASDSQEYIRMQRSPDGFLQILPKRRSRTRTHKDENAYDPESVIIPGAPTYQSEPLAEKKHHLNTHF